MKNVILNPSDWFKSWFDSAFYHSLYANRDEREAAGFIDRLLEMLKPDAQAAALDLGCGAGRHSKYLASKGLNVTGLDLSAYSIRIAGRSESPGLRFVRQDMRTPFGQGRYDYVFNFFTSFGYFDQPEENDLVMHNISRALKPGGYLLMDYLNAVCAEKCLLPEEEKALDGVIYRISRWSDERRFYKTIRIENAGAGRPMEFTEQVEKFSAGDFIRLCSNNGLEILKIFGDYALNGYDRELSPRIILLAQKK